MKEKTEMPLETLVEIQKFIGYIDGFIAVNEKIDSKLKDKIKDKIDILDEMLDNIYYKNL